MVYKINLSDYASGESIQRMDGRETFIDLVEEIISEMEVLGFRERTIFDYRYHSKKFMEVNGIKYIDEITRSSIIKYLEHGNVSPTTRRIRLKCIRAILNKLHDRGKIKDKFWLNIQVRVVEKVKVGVTASELNTLLNSLDLSEFAPFRDACLYMLLWETGVRIETATSLTMDMIDLKHLIIHFEGKIMKNGRALSLPISKQLADMLTQLDDLNKRVLDCDSEYIFLTEQKNKLTNNAFGKRVSIYKKQFGLKNINPHAIRRGFAKRLLDSGVSVPMISMVLNHSNLAVTTQYLNITNEEAIETLKHVDKK